VLPFSTLVFSSFIALAGPSPGASPDPYAVYRLAMRRLATLEQPKYIVSTEHWVTLVTYGGNSDTDQWDERRVFNSETRRECVLNVPYNPRGNSPQIGESYFAPDSWLISHYNGPALSRVAQSLQPDLSDLRTIASVVSVAKPAYDIRFDGVDSLTHGGSAYHLTLRPRFDASVHNLRELWINTQTGDITRAVIEGMYRPNYNSVPTDTFVTEDFGHVGKYWLMIHHAWAYQAPFSPRRYQYDATAVTMQFPESLPDWFFDSKLFAQHFGDVTSVLGP
jgi:hypothetical protein